MGISYLEKIRAVKKEKIVRTPECNEIENLLVEKHYVARSEYAF